MQTSTVKIFIAFAKEDRDVRDKLLRQMNLVKNREGWDIWASHEIKAGTVWNEEIKARLAGSDVIVLLMSSSFFNSNYIIDVELPAIVEKHRAGNCHIVPVLARHCLWKDTDFGGYAQLGDIQALPAGEKPVVSKGNWDSEEEAYMETVQGLKVAIKEFKDKMEKQVELERKALEEKRKQELEEKRKRKDEALKAKMEAEAEVKKQEEEKIRLEQDNKRKEEEILVKFNAAINSGNQLLENNKWDEAKVAFTDALSLLKAGFVPDKTNIKKQISKCDIEIKKIKDRERVEEARRAQIAAENKKLVNEKQDQERKGTNSQGNQNSAFQPSGVAKESKWKLTDYIIFFFPATTFITIVFSIHYSVRIYFLGYETKTGYWDTVFLLSILPSAILVLIGMLGGSLVDTKWNTLGSFIIFFVVLFIVGDFFYPSYSYYAFDRGYLIEKENKTTVQDGKLNTIIPDTVIKNVSVAEKDSLIFSKSGIPSTVDNGKNPDQNNEKKSNLTSLKKIKPELETVVILDSNKYYPVAGIFTKRENAFSEVKKLKFEGLSCSVGQCAYSDYYWVILSTRGFESKIDAENALKKVLLNKRIFLKKC